MVATLTEEGIEYVQQALNIENLYAPEHFDMMPYLDNALRAHALYRRDKDYIVRANEVIIVDEFTGRLMEGRRYSEGLHQAIEAKEGVKVQKESMTLATITFQNFFRMYSKLSGMTGTAKTEEEEFQKIYDLDVIQIPTYRPVVRDDMDDLVYRNQAAKFKAVLEDIAEKHTAGQPVLVGTVAIETSEYVSDMLKRRGIEHEVLNAKNHEREATIIAQAGRPGAVTIATNMAGRGVDILLGGNAEGLAREALRREQIELTLIRQAEWNHTLDLLKHGQEPTAVYPDQRWVEVLAAKWRETEQDKDRVRGVGGLHVVGTERHEARRIDNQLRGRSGRLGDPGSSRFYLSLEDDLMRKFGGERIGSIMARLGVEDDVPIEAGLVNRAIENSQVKVEGYNFDTRKHVLRYDEVVNEQRNRIYDERRRILTEPSLKLTIEGMIEDEVEELVTQFTTGEFDDQWQLEELGLALKALVHKLPDDFSPEQWQTVKRDAIVEEAVELAKEVYAAKDEEMTDAVMRQAEKQIMLWAVDNRWIPSSDRPGSAARGHRSPGLCPGGPVGGLQEGSLCHVRGLAGRHPQRHGEGSLQRPGGAAPGPGASRGGPGQSQAGPTLAHGPEYPHQPGTCAAPDHAQERARGGPQRPLLVREREEVQTLPHAERHAEVGRAAGVGATVGVRHWLDRRAGGTTRTPLSVFALCLHKCSIVC